MQTVITSSSVEATVEIGKRIGGRLKGGEVIELVSDLGGGKTTLVRGIAEGFGASTPASSPSFTITNVYGSADGKQINHFDFYRLQEPGIIREELAEILGRQNEIVIIEWAEVVSAILPTNRVVISFRTTSETKRIFTIGYQKQFAYLFG